MPVSVRKGSWGGRWACGPLPDLSQPRGLWDDLRATGVRGNVPLSPVWISHWTHTVRSMVGPWVGRCFFCHKYPQRGPAH